MLFNMNSCKSAEGKCVIFTITSTGLGFYPKSSLPTLKITVNVCNVCCLDNDILS